MNNTERGFRLALATGTMFLAGCGRVESKNTANPVDPNVALASESDPIVAKVDRVIAEMPGVVEVTPVAQSSFEIVSQETKQGITKHTFDATAKYSRHASSQVMPDGTRLFTALTPGDQSYGVAPADLPPFKGYSAENLIEAINWFNLTTSQRYQYNDRPYCNIWVWDISRALRAELPHYVKDRHGNPMETNANWLYLWLSGKGADSQMPYWVWGRASDYGWRKVDATNASELAGQGFPVFAAVAAPEDSRYGHIALVIPGEPVAIDGRYYPLVATAGAETSIGESAFEVFKIWILGGVTGKGEKVEYFVHEEPSVLEHNGDGLSIDP